MAEKTTYATPSQEVVEVKIEGVICGSEQSAGVTMENYSTAADENW